MKGKVLDWNYILLILSLCLASIASYVWSDTIMSGIRSFFQFPLLTLIAGAFSTIVTLCHKIKTRKFQFSQNMSFNDFKFPVEDTLSFLSNPVTIVCSLVLAKGLFLQSESSVSYFPLFDNLQMTFIGIVTSYLIFTSLIELGGNLRDTITNPNKKFEIPQAITEEQYKEGSGHKL